MSRVDAVLERIHTWFREHEPSALERLAPPAAAVSIARLEAALGVELPDAFWRLYESHDGERRGRDDAEPGPGFWGDHAFYSLDRILDQWRFWVDLAREISDAEETPADWRRQVEDGVLVIDGPVKPWLGSPLWVPFSDLNGDIVRHLDFDPAPGGTPGQVIEIDPEGCSHRVLAPSFEAFLERWAEALESGRGLEESDAAFGPPSSGLPAYLRDPATPGPRAVVPTQPASTALDLDSMSVDELIVVEGEMGLVIGGPQTFFSLRLDDGDEVWVLAASKRTRGYASIAVRQRARVRAQRYADQIPFQLAALAGGVRPQLLARSYEVVESD